MSTPSSWSARRPRRAGSSCQGRCPLPPPDGLRRRSGWVDACSGVGQFSRWYTSWPAAPGAEPSEGQEQGGDDCRPARWGCAMAFPVSIVLTALRVSPCQWPTRSQAQSERFRSGGKLSGMSASWLRASVTSESVASLLVLAQHLGGNASAGGHRDALGVCPGSDASRRWRAHRGLAGSSGGRVAAIPGGPSLLYVGRERLAQPRGVPCRQTNFVGNLVQSE